MNLDLLAAGVMLDQIQHTADNLIDIQFLIIRLLLSEKVCRWLTILAIEEISFNARGQWPHAVPCPENCI